MPLFTCVFCIINLVGVPFRFISLEQKKCTFWPQLHGFYKAMIKRLTTGRLARTRSRSIYNACRSLVQSPVNLHCILLLVLAHKYENNYLQCTSSKLWVYLSARTMPRSPGLVSLETSQRVDPCRSCWDHDLGIFSQNIARFLDKMSKLDAIDRIVHKHPDVPGASIAVVESFLVSTHTTGCARVSTSEPLTDKHFIQCASLSKTVAAAFAHEYFASKGISMTTSVNALLRSAGSQWLIIASDQRFLADDVTLSMLLNHTALGMHYVFGIPLSTRVPTPLELIDGSAKQHGYEVLRLERPAGTVFSYSGGGFVVMQYLLELMEGTSIESMSRSFLDGCGLQDFTFSQVTAAPGTRFAYGHKPSGVAKGSLVEVEPLAFPPLAAGALCTPAALAGFLCALATAYSDPQGCGTISHTTALQMLSPQYLLDLGAIDFMGAQIGSGVFVATAGENSIMLHQAANDGVRGLYMLCFAGPDRGKGFVVLCNGDNPAVLCQCEIARWLLGPAGLNFSGVNFGRWKESDLTLDFASMKQETIVNRGLKDMVVAAFENKHNSIKVAAAGNKVTSRL